MAFDSRVQADPSVEDINKETFTREGNLILPDIIAENPQTPLGRRSRQLIRWRVPGIGFVDMYINPQQMQIQEKKIIQKQRTKGGYVVQYWGEELISIRLDGNTGASGIEGINILRKVYRAEQDAFHRVEQILSDRLNSLASGGTSLSSLARRASEGGVGSALGGLVSDVLGGAKNPPLLPTLGSLALSVELYYQGWVFKGFFEEFSVTESVQNGVGLFSYSMLFTVTDRRGFRTNFMPWHRSPATFDRASGNPNGFNKSNADTTPLNFGGEK
jgi:hypothetical protein